MEIKVYPFSYKEALLIDENLTFEEYVKYGGMPPIYDFEDFNSKIGFLELLYNTIIYKDIKKKCKIKNEDLLDRILLFVISNLGQTFSVTNIFNVLKNEKNMNEKNIKIDTIYNY